MKHQHDNQNSTTTTTTTLTGALVDAQVREAVHAQTHADMPQHIQDAIMDEWIPALKDATREQGVTCSIEAAQAVHPLNTPTLQVYETCEEALNNVDLDAIINKHIS